LFLNFGFSFLLPQVIKSTSIYRGWKRAIFFSIGKNFNNSRLSELVTLDRRRGLCFVIRPERAIPEDREMSIVRWWFLFRCCQIWWPLESLNAPTK
jgi:hypothetical protein